MTLPFVSIIIPTYNDWYRLSLCLGSLQVQSYKQESFEIIVANNNANDPIPSNFAIPSNCIIITEPKPGSYAARNSAINLAKGSIIGFTDSDCIADADWITNAVSIFNCNSEVDRIGGKIDIFYQKNRPSKIELHDRIFAFRQEGYVNGGYAVTGNMFTRKDVFEKVGRFNDKIMSVI